ncbi:membrane protein [Spirochaetia bacterium]|nr:membrane protein [Spirochaetia bacterium]
MFTLLILADDLTGALDTGVQFAKKGIPTRVVLSPEGKAENSAAESAAVLVINTGTRHSSLAEAGKIITACLDRYRDIPYIYKKTDSTLRGNIGAELEALVMARNIQRLPFVPAYPGLGRTTAGGHQLLKGIPIDKTDMAVDALNPIRHSFIPDIIGEESDIPVRLIPAKGSPPAPNLESKRREILVYDCENAGELRDIAHALKEQGSLSVTAGCAGFAEFLMEELPFPARVAPGGLMAAQAGSGKENIPRFPVLILSGSRHPVSLSQVKAALESGFPGITVDGEKLLREEWFTGEEAAALEDNCAKTLKQHGVCILGTAMAMGQITERANAAVQSQDKWAEQKNQNGRATGTAGVAGLLGKFLKNILKRTGPLHLVIFGGDTLLGIMEILKFDYIIPIEEIRPGIVLARAEGKGGSSFIVTKSGAFGDPGMIETIRSYFS